MIMMKEQQLGNIIDRLGLEADALVTGVIEEIDHHTTIVL